MSSFTRSQRVHEASTRPKPAYVPSPFRREVRRAAWSDPPSDDTAARPPIAFDFGRISVLPPGGRPERRAMPPLPVASRGEHDPWAAILRGRGAPPVVQAKLEGGDPGPSILP